MNDDECDIETTSRVTRYQFTLLFGMEWPIQATLPDAMMRARYPTEVSWCLGENRSFAKTKLWSHSRNSCNCCSLTLPVLGLSLIDCVVEKLHRCLTPPREVMTLPNKKTFKWIKTYCTIFDIYFDIDLHILYIYLRGNQHPSTYFGGFQGALLSQPWHSFENRGSGEKRNVITSFQKVTNHHRSSQVVICWRGGGKKKTHIQEKRLRISSRTQ